MITRSGRVRYQMRTEKGSPITGISYKGDFELSGGRVNERDLRVVLTPEKLLEEAIRETKEELGIAVSADFTVSANAVCCGIYRTVFTNPKDGKIDWAFAIAVPPYYWDEDAEVKRKIIDADPDDLNVLGKLNLIVSGKKRMWRMGQAGIYLASDKKDYVNRAAELLTEVKLDWRQTELLLHPGTDLLQIRYGLGLE